MRILKFEEEIKWPTTGEWNRVGIYEFIKKYHYFNDELIRFIFYKENLDLDEDEIFISDFFIMKNKLVVKYNDSSGNDLTYTISDIDEFVMYLNDPEFFEDLDRYNI